MDQFKAHLVELSDASLGDESKKKSDIAVIGRSGIFRESSLGDEVA